MLSSHEAAKEAQRIMLAFAERSGLDSGRPAQRYLWTDAHAVCNFLALSGALAAPHHFEQARVLVEQVHYILGRHRADDSRKGWLSGLAESEGARHPTRGGLRIGKRLPERGPDEPVDELLEWERDGQYFHYLTKWMHALDQMARATGEAHFNAWSRELAAVACERFTHRSRRLGGEQLAWKMSIDLRRPLVVASGQHDALDGLITSVQLESTASALARDYQPDFTRAEALARMLDLRSIRTSDPLGVGGLLFDTCRIAQLVGRGEERLVPLFIPVLTAALHGVIAVAESGLLRHAASRRLAFRELGLAIGLSAPTFLAQAELSRIGSKTEQVEVRSLLTELTRHAALGRALVAFWLSPEAQEGHLWGEHRDINEVMLATSLVPEGFMRLSRAA